MGRKWISVILAAWILLMMPMAAFAQTVDFDRTGSVSVTLIDRDGKTPITGAELSLYYVATVGINNSYHLSYTFTDAFRDCGAELEDPDLASALDAFVQEHAVPVKTQATDAQGSAVFTDLPLGLYFMKQTNTVAGYAPCTSFLVTVPNQNGEDYAYDVNASPKTDVARLTDITIRKVWNTDASTKATDNITVQLLRNDVVAATAILNDENAWQVTYLDLPESDAYSIQEVNVPKGFTATYQQNGYVFTVTNTATLAQTGQLLWPIPVLAISGMLLIAVGIALLQKKRKTNG